jgi:superfamily I DNA/RNA helicase
VYPGQFLGVLVPHRKDVEKVVQQLLNDSELAGQITNAMSRDFDSTMPVWVSTVHSSKGLEFRAVHLIAADQYAVFHEHERRVAFTAVTRAKTALTIYHEQPLHAFFASALAKPNTEKITVKRLFGKAS